MATISNLETKISLQTLSNELILEMKKINIIRKVLLNLAKKEVSSFRPLKVQFYKEKKEDQKDENKIKIPTTFKIYFEDYKKYKGFISQIESNLVISSNDHDSIQIEQIDSSDLVNSD